MNIKSLLLILIVATGVHSYGQKMIAQYKGFNSKWGYIDMNGKLITKPIFNNCQPFHNGFARVNEKKFINANGEELITSEKIQLAHDFNEGYAQVMIKDKWGVDKWGFMNTKGELTFPAIFTKVTDFIDGYALGLNNDALFILKTTGESIEIKNEKGAFVEKGKLFDVKEFYGGLASIAVDFIPGPNDKLLYGFINTKGEIVIKPEYINTGNFKEVLTWVETVSGDVGFIDKAGNMVVEPKYIKVGEFSNGMAWVRVKGGEEGFVNSKGEEVIAPKYIAVRNFDSENGLAWVKMKGGDIGFVNLKGEEVIAPQFKDVGDFDSVSGLARVVTNKGEKGYVNIKGEIKRFKNTNIFKHFTEGLCVEEIDKLVGFIDNTGEWIISPKFKVATPFKNGFSKVKMSVNYKNRWGIIDKTGNYVIEPQFMNIYEFYSAE